MSADVRDVEATSVGDALGFLQKHIGAGNAAKGFHERGVKLRTEVKHIRAQIAGGSVTLDEELEDAVQTLREYETARIALIAVEAGEAIEELRDAHASDETYYSRPPIPASLAVEFASGAEARAAWEERTPGKPEGVPSEIADVVIRAFDFAHEAEFDLAAIIAEKLAYNATRAHKHGKKF